MATVSPEKAKPTDSISGVIHHNANSRTRSNIQFLFFLHDKQVFFVCKKCDDSEMYFYDELAATLKVGTGERSSSGNRN